MEAEQGPSAIAETMAAFAIQVRATAAKLGQFRPDLIAALDADQPPRAPQGFFMPKAARGTQIQTVTLRASSDHGPSNYLNSGRLS